ncbi:MAG: response regulator transcription factor [Vicinamibacterales bacterium]
MAPDRIRVLCVDDHAIVRQGLALIIEEQRDMEVVGLAASGEEAVELFRRHRPNVTLMDLQLGVMSGVQAIRALRTEDPGARIVALTVYQGDEDIYQALEAGASAYLLKDTLADDLIRVVRHVYAGGNPDLAEDVKASLAERATRPTLTARERQVLELIALGMQNNEIGAALIISPETVHVHAKSILAKLGVRNRNAAVNVAVRRGIIHIA